MERVAERIIADSVRAASVGGQYASALIEAIYAAPPVRRSALTEPRAYGLGQGGAILYHEEIRVELTVRPFTDPGTGRRRWAMLLDSDELRITDYPTRSEAEQAYRALVIECARDDPASWTTTDVRVPAAT